MEVPEFKNNSYWFGKDGPFCSACWDTKDDKVRLHKMHYGYAACPAGKGHPNVLAFPEEKQIEDNGPKFVDEFDPL